MLSGWGWGWGWWVLPRMHTLTLRTPSVLPAAFMCMVMLIAYCWLSLLSVHSLLFISPSLVKGIKTHWPLCCLLSRLLYWVCVWASVCVCAYVRPLPTASKSLFPLISHTPLFFYNLCFLLCVLSLPCLAWCRRRRRMSRTQVPEPVCDCLCTPSVLVLCWGHFGDTF